MSKISLKDFLKKFTAIPGKFIDEYYKFYELCETNKFGISIELLVKYLGISSQTRLETRLRESFKHNVDYVIIREKQKLTKGIKDAHYMLSFETFEKICMNSSTKKGQEFRDYFVMLRQFIDYYKEHIADKLMALTQTNKFMYILAVNKKSNIMKLGRTANMRKRLQSYSTGKLSHPDVKFIMIVEDDKRVEKCAKLFAKMFQYKANKELYKLQADNLKRIVFNCANMEKDVINILEKDKSLKTYIIYDDSKTIEYLNLDGDVIGMERTGSVTKTKKKANPASRRSLSSIN